MKLAEAKNSILEIEIRLIALRDRINQVPLQSVGEILEEINNITAERQQLQILLSTIEADTFVAGNSLRDLYFVIESLDNRLITLKELQNRKDLTEEIASNIFKQIDEFSKIRHKLKNSMDQAYWQVDLDL